MPDAAPAAWVHNNCLADYARPFAFRDLSQSELAAARVRSQISFGIDRLPIDRGGIFGAGRSDQLIPCRSTTQ